VLDLIAGAQAVPNVLQAIARIIERSIPGASCALAFRPQGRANAAPRKLSAVTARRRHGYSSCTEELIALAESVGRTSATEESATWLAKIRSRGGSPGGDLALTLTTRRPIGVDEEGLIAAGLRLGALAVEYRQLDSVVASYANTDRATGLPNRHALELRLARLIGKSSSRSMALIWIGFDRFNDIDESVGYRTTNALLRAIAQRIGGTLQTREWVAQAAPNDFAVVCDDATAADAAACAERILHALELPFPVNGCEFYLAARVGIAVCPDHGGGAAVLQQNAFNASRLAHLDGTTKYVFYQDELAAGLRFKRQIEQDLRHAVERNELVLVYQPQVCLNDRFFGMEALIRWQHPTLGMLEPDKFIEVAEETGLIVAIGEWVISEACRQSAEWNTGLGRPVKVSVNVSALQLYFSDLPEIIERSLTQWALPASCLEIELTETAVMRNADEAAKTLQKLRDLGVSVAIDDFGIGYSSLSYLAKLPVDLLKIDRMFLQQIHTDTTATVVCGIAALGHSLGLSVVAEGVETMEQWEKIRSIGVDIAQGFLIGRPMHADKALEWMMPHVRDGRFPARLSE
jgi:diguanylate cyclase (GGDEF)-like protein